MRRSLAVVLLWSCLAARAAAVVGGEWHESRVSVNYAACTDEERQRPSRVHFVFPRRGQRLDSVADLALGRNLLVRMRTERFRPGVTGRVVVLLMGHNVADLQGNQEGHNYKTVTVVSETNVELFGLTEGSYMLSAVLTDLSEVGRDCWENDAISFSIVKKTPSNRSEALLAGLKSLSQSGGRMAQLRSHTPWLMQPRRHTDFGYVTAIWGEDYIDNVLAWSASLAAVGSTFPRYCMIIPELLWEGYHELLRRCCCELLPVEPIHAPWEATRGQWSRYQLVLTKLRVFQLGRFGLRKLVLMDADMLVLQNIDELFWTPAPASTLLPGSMLGAEGPKISAGTLVIETSESEFEAVMERLRAWTAAASEKDAMLFIEQDLMDLHWQTPEGRPMYHVLPCIYNLNPSLLDTLPFLVPANASDEGLPRFPIDHGVKVLHLWNWFNPVLATSNSARQAMQLHARMKHKQLWRWYEIWWDMHQLGMSKALPGKYPIWKEQCVEQNVARYGEFHASKMVPVMQGGGGRCMHVYGGLGW